MKRILFFALLGLYLAFPHKSRGRHFIGGHIAYQHLSGNLYRVEVHTSSEGSGAGSIRPQITVRSDSACGTLITTREIRNLTRLNWGDHISALVHHTSLGHSYSSSIFVDTLTLPGYGVYHLQFEVGSRMEARNLNVGVFANLVLQTSINHQPGITNSSVAFPFFDRAVRFINHQELSRLSLLCHDPDGDSLSFELVQPRSNCSTYLPYANTGLPFALIDSTQTPPVLLIGASNLSRYSARMPIASLRRVMPGPNEPYGQLVPYFLLDSTSSASVFQPHYYTPFQTPVSNSNPNNHYVAVKISEWRRVSGQVVKVGETVREMLVIILKRLGRVSPTYQAIASSPTWVSQEPTSTFYARAGQTDSLSIAFSSGHNNEVLQVQYNRAQVPSYSWNTLQVQRDSSARPEVRIVTQAQPADIGQQYYVTFRVLDQGRNDLFRGETFLTVKVIIVPSNFVGLAEAAKPRFTLAPNPSTGVFRLSGEIPTSLEVLSLTGQSLLQVRPESAGDEYTLRMDAQPAGVYILRAVDGQGRVSSTRLIKN